MSPTSFAAWVEHYTNCPDIRAVFLAVKAQGKIAVKFARGDRETWISLNEQLANEDNARLFAGVVLSRLA